MLAKKDTAFDEKQNTAIFEQLKHWRYQVYESQMVWQQRLLFGFIGLSLLFAVTLGCFWFLLPLKQTIPFLFTVNEKTGELTQIGEFKPEKFSEAWVLTRFLLIQYVVNRESYDADHLERPYQLAFAMSEEGIAQQYAKQVRTDNPHSPFAAYGKNKFIEVHVLSVHRLNDYTAEVRFEQVLQDRLTGNQQIMQKAAIVKWRYTQPKTTLQMLDRDPLGFKVTYYQVTQVNLDS